METSRLHPRYIRRRIVLLMLLNLMVISGISIAMNLWRGNNNMLHSRFEESPDNEISYKNSLSRLRASEQEYGFPGIKTNEYKKKFEILSAILTSNDEKDEAEKKWKGWFAEQHPEMDKESQSNIRVWISNAWVTFAYSTPENVIYLRTYDLDGNLLTDLTDKLEVWALPHIFNCVQGADGAPLYIVSYVKDNASYGLGILSSDGTDMTKGERYDAITYRDNIFCAVKYFGREDEIKGPLNVLSGNEFNTRSETTYLDMNCNTLFEPIKGLGYDFSNGYAAIQFTGDYSLSYINTKGKVVLRDISYPLGFFSPGPAGMNIASRPDIHYVYRLLNEPIAGELFDPELEREIITFEGKKADIRKDCSPLMDIEYLFLGIWELGDKIIWLGDNREAQIYGDPQQYSWAVFDFAPYDGANGNEKPILALQDESGTITNLDIPDIKKIHVSYWEYYVVYL